jgi:von Willebrand factor type A domain
MAHLVDWRAGCRGGYMQPSPHLWPRRLFVIALLLPIPCLAQSKVDSLIIGGYRTPQPNHLELLLELPPGVAKIQAREIRLVEDERATTHASAVNGFRDARWTVSTVLAIDTSRSMTKYLAPVRAALPDFIATLPQNDSVALITFNDDVHQEALFEASRDQIAARIQNLHTAGTRTSLHRALDQSLTMLQLRQGDRIRRRTLLVSDGWEES